MSGRNFLFVPGPTNVPDRVLRAMHRPMEDHRSSDFPSLALPLFENLKKVFKTTSGQAFIFPASGTGAWEASLSNTLSPGDRVLAARFGMFSHLWIDMAQRLGLQCVPQLAARISLCRCCQSQGDDLAPLDTSWLWRTAHGQRRRAGSLVSGQLCGCHHVDLIVDQLLTDCLTRYRLAECRLDASATAIRTHSRPFHLGEPRRTRLRPGRCDNLVACVKPSNVVRLPGVVLIRCGLSCHHRGTE